MSIYSVYPSILEGIPETHIQVDGIHGKGNCIEIFLENIIQSPCKVCMYSESFESIPSSTGFYSPLECTQVIREIIWGGRVSHKFRFNRNEKNGPALSFTRLLSW